MTTLQHSVELAQFSEEWGYKRYWFAEHHSTKGLASTAPEIMIARIAAQTNTIRVGSGGVLLPQYSPFKVAETFRQLEALYPNRIDLGVGRSPGGTTKTRLALTDGVKKSLTEFNRQLQDVSYFLTDSLPPDHPYAGIKAAAPYWHGLPSYGCSVLVKTAQDARRTRGLDMCLGISLIPSEEKMHSASTGKAFGPQPIFQIHPHCLRFLSFAQKQMKRQKNSH
nr:MsnO8 family LLM class oxidoreductase [Bacillus subtilis]